MSEPEMLIDVTDTWVSGSSAVQSVEIPELRGSPRFALLPSDLADRTAVACRYGYCRHCDGKGYVPTAWGKEMRGVPCPKCRGKSKSLDNAEVRLGLLREYVTGWEHWLTASGAEVPYSDQVVANISRDHLLSGLILGYSQRLMKDVREAEGKTSEAGREA